MQQYHFERQHWVKAEDAEAELQLFRDELRRANKRLADAERKMWIARANFCAEKVYRLDSMMGRCHVFEDEKYKKFEERKIRFFRASMLAVRKARGIE